MTEKFPDNIPLPTQPSEMSDPLIQARLTQRANEAQGYYQPAVLEAQERQDLADYARHQQGEPGAKADIADRLALRLAEDPFHKPNTETENRYLNRFRDMTVRYGEAPSGKMVDTPQGPKKETYAQQQQRLLAEAETEGRDWEAKTDAERYNVSKLIAYRRSSEILKEVQEEALNKRRAEQGRPSIDEEPGGLLDFSKEVAEAINEGRFPRAMDNATKHMRGSGQTLAVIHGKITGTDAGNQPVFIRGNVGVGYHDIDGEVTSAVPAGDPEEARIENMFVPQIPDSEKQQIGPEAWDKVMGALNGEIVRVDKITREQSPAALSTPDSQVETVEDTIETDELEPSNDPVVLARRAHQAEEERLLKPLRDQGATAEQIKAFKESQYRAEAAQNSADMARGERMAVRQRMLAQLALDPFMKAPLIARDRNVYSVHKSVMNELVPGTQETYADRKDRLYAEAEDEAWDIYNAENNKTLEKPAYQAKIEEVVKLQAALPRVQSEALDRHRQRTGEIVDATNAQAFSGAIAKLINSPNSNFPRVFQNIAAQPRPGGIELAIVHGQVSPTDEQGRPRFLSDGAQVYMAQSEQVSGYIGPAENPYSGQVERIFVPLTDFNTAQNMTSEQWMQVLQPYRQEISRVNKLNNPIR